MSYSYWQLNIVILLSRSIVFLFYFKDFKHFPYELLVDLKKVTSRLEGKNKKTKKNTSYQKIKDKNHNIKRGKKMSNVDQEENSCTLSLT